MMRAPRLLSPGPLRAGLAISNIQPAPSPMPKLPLSRLALLASLCAAIAVPSAHPLSVDAKAKPSDAQWRQMPTRTVDSLPGFIPEAEVPLTVWGGWAAERRAGPGFFRVHREPDGRWWLLDPDGCLFLHVGVAGVYRGLESAALKTTGEKFADGLAWAEFTLGLLREHRFNGLGGWTEAAAVRGNAALLPYAVSLDFCGDFGRRLGITRIDPGNTGYLNDVPPILHPDFAAWCDSYAREKAAPLRSDRMLLGFFSDNELPLRREMLDGALSLPAEHPAGGPVRAAAEAWLRARRGEATPGATTEEERVAFLGHVCEVYYSTVASALRRHAGPHLYLGSRVHGRATRFPEVFRAAGPHVDVMSVNLYHAWSADPERLAMWARESGRPAMITEFYAKGEDAGMENESGAGWLVRTQRDRGLFYQNFALGLIESGSIVGWHWFKYRDNEPWATETDPSNRNSNKGVVSWDYRPFADLLGPMRELNSQVYPLARYFGARRASVAGPDVAEADAGRRP